MPTTTKNMIVDRKAEENIISTYEHRLDIRRIALKPKERRVNNACEMGRVAWRRNEINGNIKICHQAVGVKTKR